MLINEDITNINAEITDIKDTMVLQTDFNDEVSANNIRVT